MSRLIDADALSERMYHDAFETDSDMQRWDNGCWIRYKMFENAIKDAPTVEPKRKMGKWVDEPVYKQTMDGKTRDRYTYCSVCKVIYEYGYRSWFCSNCGAYMGDTDETD